MKFIFKAITNIIPVYLVVYHALFTLGNIETYEKIILCHEESHYFLPDNATKIQIPVSIFVQNIQLDDAVMEMRAYVTIKLSWNPYSNFTTPSVRFSNAIDTKINNKLFTIFPNNTFSSEKKYSIRLPCQLNLDYFPFDSQLCSMDIALINSDGCKNKDFKIKLIDKSINNQIKFKHYNLKMYGNTNISAHEFESSVDNNNDSLRIIFFWERFYTSHLIRIVLPGLILVIISWLTLWMSDKQQIVLRLSMELMTILIVSITVGTYNGSVPSVGYIKAIDIWNGTCLAFTSFSLIYSIVLHFMINFETQLNSTAHKKYDETGDELEKSVNSNDTADEGNCVLRVHYKIKKCFSVPRGFDKLFRLLYIAVFITVVLCFWKIVTNASSSRENEFMKIVQNPNFILFP